MYKVPATVKRALIKAHPRFVQVKGPKFEILDGEPMASSAGKLLYSLDDACKVLYPSHNISVRTNGQVFEVRYPVLNKRVYVDSLGRFECRAPESRAVFECSPDGYKAGATLVHEKLGAFLADLATIDQTDSRRHCVALGLGTGVSYHQYKVNTPPDPIADADALTRAEELKAVHADFEAAFKGSVGCVPRGEETPAQAEWRSRYDRLMAANNAANKANGVAYGE